MDVLTGIRVVDLAGGLAAGYAAKLFADAGASATFIEPPGGDSLRHASVAGPDQGGALFAHLRASQQVVADGTAAAADALAGADIVVVDRHHPQIDRAGVVTLSITPYGRTGPYAERPATEFTLQADSGGLANRGHPAGQPFQAGGRTSTWMAGLYGALAALAAHRRVGGSAASEVIDVSEAEVANLAMATFADLYHQLEGRPDTAATVPWSQETPSIEPTADGYVGFNTNTRQQLDDFCALIGRPDVAETFASLGERARRWDEWNQLVHAYTTQHRTAEIVELASALRIPVAPVCNGATVLELDHFAERGVFERHPDGFRAPRRPYRFHARGARDAASASPPAPAEPAHEGALPLAGVRVLDATAWWAGPTATQLLAALGADVIHVESITRPDGMRMVGGRFYGQDQWWERSWFFLGANTNKRGLTLDLATDQGRQLFLDVAATCDVVVENFTPRVFDGFGIGWEEITAANPRTILVRMPAFGLDGPWRDRPGFAQTMEQVTGLAWVTGFADDQPRIQRGPCDPNAGAHATWAVLVALAERDRTGAGVLVETPMVEAALNIAAEQVIEYTAHGTVLQREGNRSPHAAPQNLYATTDGPRRPVAISVATDEQWQALCTAIERADWAADPRLATHHQRRAHLDELDGGVEQWTAARSTDQVVEQLVAHGVPAAPLGDPRLTAFHPQFVHRGFCEPVDHPVLGELVVPVVPFRFGSVDRWIRRPAPTLGGHNADVLAEAGIDPAELARLEAEGVIGTTPTGLG